MFDIYKNWQEVEDAAKDNDELAQFISLFEDLMPYHFWML